MLRFGARRGYVVALAVLTGVALVGSVALAGHGAVVVTPDDVTGAPGEGWTWDDFGSEATGVFTPGPAHPPVGEGSFRLETTDGNDQGWLYSYDVGPAGTRLSDVGDIQYATFRHASSTADNYRVPALRLLIDYGDGEAWLVYEPVHNPDQGAVLAGLWQTWDATDDGDARWWPSDAVPGADEPGEPVAWDDIVAHNPEAELLGVSFTAGGGWSGTLTANVDALVIGGSTFDFERVAAEHEEEPEGAGHGQGGPPDHARMADCKQGGWQHPELFGGTEFRNQGDCVSYFASGARRGPPWLR